MNFQSKSSLIVFLAISLWCIGMTYAAKKKSSVKKCDNAKVDRCATELAILTDESFVFPKSIPEVNKLCKKLKSQEICVKDHANNCFDGTPRQSLTVMVYSIGRANKGLCSNQKRKNQIIKMGECLQPEFKTLNQITKDLVDVVHGIQHYKPAKLRVPMTCCAFHRYKEQLLDAVRKNCEDFVPEMDNIVNGYSQDALNLLCTEYTEDSDKCDPIFDKIPENKKKAEWKTFIFPMVEILNSDD